jgi:hypothetical protein
LTTFQLRADACPARGSPSVHDLPAAEEGFGVALCVLTFLVLAYPPTKEGRNVRRTALIRIGIGCAAFAVWEGPVFSLLNVERPDLSIEAISIPAMEIARSSSHGDLDEELVARVGVDQETLAQEYADRTHCADTVRWEFHFALEDKNYADILRLWANARALHFSDSVNADLAHTVAAYLASTPRRRLHLRLC